MCKTSAKTQDGRSAQGDALLAKNIPSHVHIENLKRLCGWLEMLRSEWNKRYGEGDDPIVINSGYRSEAVNKAVGGAKGSNHLTGCAADIRVAGMEQRQSQKGCVFASVDVIDLSLGLSKNSFNLPSFSKLDRRSKFV